MSDRRFTDKEVALILRRASELEDSRGEGSVPGRGLSLTDLQEIAAEAGINPDLIGRAVAELEDRRSLDPVSLLGPTTVSREVRAVADPVSEETLAELIRIIDQEVKDQGTVQEALGAVRWTGKSLFLSTQVSLEPSEEETLVRVEERYTDALRGMLHGIPSSYGLILGLPIFLEGLNLGAPLSVALAVATGAAGWALGDTIWRRLARKSRTRVGRLAEKLTMAASRALPPLEPPK